jgi:mRNA interferase MazF
LRDYPLVRLDVKASGETGLPTPSQIMVDKAGTVRRDKIGRRIGCLDRATMQAASAALSKFLGLD